ncbi:MAG: M23 family metallopeptidase, partial [Spirochaetia bacterium]
LNRMEGSALGEPGRSLFLPSIPGVFVPLIPRTDLEVVMHDLRREQTAQVVSITGESTSTVFRFYPGSDFSPEERSTFLGLLFRRPLRVPTVSSAFGPRNHPVTGVWGFHAGVDFAAARGTPVLAARLGQVADTGNDPIMGNYVLLRHSGGFTTFYGHLDAVTVSLNDSVGSGIIIGTVGSTGITTGAHLHFEIRQDNDPRDPMKLLPWDR